MRGTSLARCPRRDGVDARRRPCPPRAPQWADRRPGGTAAAARGTADRDRGRA